ncbi:MAG: hypothetical protein RLW87_20850 [Alphaproteobacteria bacterium]
MPAIDIALDNLRHRLAAAGLHVVMRSDPEALYALDRQRPDRTLSPIFNPQLDAADTRWICAVDGNRDFAGCHALRLISTAGRPASLALAEDLGRLFDTVSVQGVTPELDRLRGRIVYQGDGWLRQDFRGRDLGPLLLDYGLLEACRHWDPDGAVGFFERDPFAWSYAQKSGYRHFEVFGQVWGDWLKSHEWIGWLERKDLVSLVADHSTDAAGILRKGPGRE